MTYIDTTIEEIKQATEIMNKGLKGATTHPQVEEMLLLKLDATLQSIAKNTAAIADELTRFER